MKKSTPKRMESRERFRHDHDQNQLHNLHGTERSYRAQAEFDNSFLHDSLQPWESITPSNPGSEKKMNEDLSFEQQYLTDGEVHNYRGPLQDDRYGEYPRYGKNLNRQARSARHNYEGVGPKGYVRPDDRIREEICEILARDKYIDASDIEVSVTDGIVSLKGMVDSRDDRFDAEVLVERVLGVEDIKNDIKVRKPVPLKH